MQDRFPRVAPIIARVVDTALAFDPARRWPSAAAMRNAIGNAYLVLVGTRLPPRFPVAALVPVTTEPPQRPPRRKRIWMSVAAGLLVLAVVHRCRLARLQDEQSALMEHQHLGLADVQRLAGVGELFDTLAVFEKTQGIQSGPFQGPSTGPAYVKLGRRSAPFFFEGTSNKIGTSYFVSTLAGDLSTVRLTRYGANFIPRNPPVLTSVDDINNNVGFWRPQPDFRIPERLSPGFTNFPDLELETIYEDQVRTFVRYQTSVAERAIEQNPDADLDFIPWPGPEAGKHSTSTGFELLSTVSASSSICTRRPRRRTS